MTAYTDFHYSPTGSGVISGAQVLEQTEQGINGLGQYVQDNVSGAIDTANQALTIAQTADSNATLALNTANSFASAISAANNTANNALTTAQSAQNTANTASSLATTANNNANTALNAANTATSNVATLTGTVNSLGNRMTTAENAISTNAGNITTLQTNLQTTNNNVTAAANAASSAQATATSAQSTATLARNQAYVLRYTGTTITGGGTIAYADIDNTDNIKAGDKIIDATGVIYEIASVDIANQTVTVGATAIINLAVLPDLFNSANTWTGVNTYTGNTTIDKNSANPTTPDEMALAFIAGSNYIFFRTKGSSNFKSYNSFLWGGHQGSGYSGEDRFGHLKIYRASDIYGESGENTPDTSFSFIDIALHYKKVSITDNVSFKNDGTTNAIYPGVNNATDLGTSTNKWKTLNGINPGALSLPSGGTTENTDWYNVAGDILPTGGNATSFSRATANYFTPAKDGWLALAVKNCSELSVWCETLKYGISVVAPDASVNRQVVVPVVAGKIYQILITGNSWASARLIMTKGNV